jgi:hypothetical protein
MFASKPILLLLSIILGLAAVASTAVYGPKLLYSPDGKYTIAMAGRSTMDMWFRSWNLPGVLNEISVYKKWPVPYKKYQHDSIYLEYIPVDAPHRNTNKPGVEYGQVMFNDIQSQTNDKKFDALFFKFCFVDYGDRSSTNPAEAQDRFEKMVSLVSKVHDYAKNKNMQLLLGNALPVLKPGRYGQKTREMFNEWVDKYAQENEDVTQIDLFGILSNKDGKLRKEYSVDLSDLDPHPNMEAFKLLDQELFEKLRTMK